MNSTENENSKTYAGFQLSGAIRQFVNLWNRDFKAYAKASLPRVKMDEERLAQALKVDDVAGKKILEIGPGQNMGRAVYYQMKNELIGVDLDVIPSGFDVPAYWNMLRTNGFGRFAKTLVRNVFFNWRQKKAWAETIGAGKHVAPPIYYGDFCSTEITNSVPGFGTYDAVISWSVFEHLPDPKQALQNVIDALKPGGAFLISLHLYTANDGHHDMRAFTGSGDALPLWGHLRPQHRNSIEPSSYLNEWRLHQWRELYDELAPGNTMYLDQYEHPEKFGSQLKGALKEELKDYTFEELVTVNIVCSWQKPL